jgi:1-aminocyclopropane-1-carboxylate deaminase/D-cysteine desulfhydrase-like pyridoxal-dependent ACC family enzyme
MQKLPLVQPTAITLAERVSRAVGAEVWVKHDNATHPRYGGNKVRKLEHLLAEARAEGATHLLTAGAAGSHHVLATAVHGAAAGFAVEAVVTPRPRSEHAAATTRASLAQGAVLHPCSNAADALVQALTRAAVLRAQGHTVFVIRPGGSSPRGALGYVEAMAEAAAQLRLMAVPHVDAMVVPLGSGGTLAGMMAGARMHRVDAGLVGVRVAGRWMSPRAAVASLAEATLALALPPESAVSRSFRRTDVTAVEDQVGDGYGHPTDAARDALARFAEDGVALDLTYSAKAAAGLLDLARRAPPGRRYLLWNTLSSAPLGGLMQDTAVALPPELDALLT